MNSQQIRRVVRFPPETMAEIDARANEDKVSFDEEVRRILKKQLSVDAASDNIIIEKLNGLKKTTSDILTQLTLQWYVIATFMQEFLLRNPSTETGPSEQQKRQANMEFKELLNNMFRDMKARRKSFFDEVMEMVTEIPPMEETQ